MINKILSSVIVILLLFLSANIFAVPSASVIASPPYFQELYTQHSQGEELLNNHRFKEANNYWREIIKTNSSNLRLQGFALYNLSIAQYMSGQLLLARNSLNLAIKKIAIDSNKELIKPLMAKILSQLGIIELELGNLVGATEQLFKARVLAIQLQDNYLEALILSYMAKISAKENNHSQAVSLYTKSVGFAQSINHVGLTVAGYIGQVKGGMALQDLKKSSDFITELFQYFEQLPSVEKNHPLQVIAIADLLSALSENSYTILNDNVTTVTRQLERITQTANRTNDHYLASSALGARAILYHKANLLDDALFLTNQAIIKAQKIEAKTLLVRWLWLAGRISRQLQNDVQAVKSYRLAIENLQPIRDQLLSAQGLWDQMFSYFDENIYLTLADLLLSQSSNKSKLDAQALLVEARDTVEKQKVVELQNYFKDTCVVSARDNFQRIDKKLAVDSAVLYPILLPNRIELLVSFNDGIQRFVVNETKSKVKSTVDQFRANLENLNSRDYLTQAAMLYSWLIKPFDSELKKRGISTLVVISETSLRTVPFSVLYDGRRFLIENYAVAVSPGLLMTDQEPFNRENLKVLLSGLSESVGGFPPLHYVQGELDEIQDLYVNKLLMNKEFITENFRQSIRNTDYAVAHVASHSEFTGDVNNSYILTYDGRMSMDQLSKFTAVGRDRQTPIELLTLSACQTAVGDDKAALGLAGVAVRSGARSALATLWAIDDFASSLLVSEFYKQLLDSSVSKAQALQRAQKKLLKARRFAHPAYWSPFLLIGNWL